MTDPRWTDETAELVKLAIGDARYDDGSSEQAANVLAVLTDAGLLVPPGSEIEEQRAYRFRAVDDTGYYFVRTYLDAAPGQHQRNVIFPPWTEITPDVPS